MNYPLTSLHNELRQTHHTDSFIFQNKYMMVIDDVLHIWWIMNAICGASFNLILKNLNAYNELLYRIIP